jgi:SRSO17 transposase
VGRCHGCQVGVFLAYASVHGHALIDRELYLPQSWIEDRDRCRAAGIPGDIEFATKPRQAQAMISRAIEAGVPFAWFTAGTCWSGSPGLDASPEVVEGDAVVERGAVNDPAVASFMIQA